MNNDYSYYNSFSIFDSQLNLIDNYNKINLVPFGEFVPVENMLNKFGLKTITNNIGSFNKGDNRDIIQLKNGDKKLNFLPLICYEIIYSGNLTRNFEFDFILNISEDGWFGKSIGIDQHFFHSVFRSIEEGKNIIRSANNGISAYIDSNGVIVSKLESTKKGVIEINNYKSIKKTFFSKFGNNIFFYFILFYIILIFFNFKKREK